ncbi:MAG: hypothetical protein RQ833_11605 [Sphingomonadaceae bacterium]|nr:hypothetical protein [Sphingomonadaceae bacterium]
MSDWRLTHGDAWEALAALDPESVDAIVTTHSAGCPKQRQAGLNGDRA